MNLAELFHHETDLLIIPADRPLFTEGGEADRIFVLLEGRVKILVGDTVVEEAGPGALLGEMALIDHAPRSATVITVTDCKFVTIDERRFLFLITQTPNFALHVMKVMADRLRNTGRALTSLARS